jgi:ribonuclease BN (tRNA processing enzyme)
MWAVNRRSEPVTIYVPEHTLEFFELIHTISYNFRERLTFEVTYETLRPFPLRDGWSAATFATHHLDGVRELAEKYRHATTAYGYIITNGDRKVVLSQDIDGARDLRDHIACAELVVCESAHVDPLELLELAHASGVRRVLFTHVPPEVPEFPSSFDAIAWSIASDGERLEI